MFPMNPAMSWLLMIALALLIAAPLTVMYRRQRRRAAATAAAHERLAPVIELRPRRVPTERQLAIVPELRDVENARRLHLASKPKPAPSVELYDWATQGV